MGEFATRGVGNAALTTGIIGTAGTAMQVLPGLFGGLFGNRNCGCNGMQMGYGMPIAVCSEDQPVNRYEAGKDAKIAELETEIKLRDANFYTLGEMGKLRDYVDTRFDKVEDRLCKQAIHNERTTMGLDCLAGQVAGINAVIGKITGTVIPKDVICPEVMPRYNTWVAPAATETATATT